jgi:hypothetical protein
LNEKIFIAAVLVIATVLSAGLVLLPSYVHEAEANPCSGISARLAAGDLDTECLFAGDIEITPAPGDMGRGSGTTAADIPLLDLADLFDESD